jgi:Glycosyltransferase like family 2
MDDGWRSRASFAATQAQHNAWADEAANGLLRARPGASAASGIETRQIVSVAAPAFFILILGLTSPFAGQLLGLAGVTLFLLLIGLRAAAALTPLQWAPRNPLNNCELPVITVFAPVYREASVLAQLMRGLSAFDYPREKLDIKIIVEADDIDTINAARALRSRHDFEIIQVPDGTPRTKPRAMNYALNFARGEIVTVYDAEDCPHPAQLRHAAEAFAAGGSDLACVQAPLNWYNAQHNWLTRQFALEYATQFHAILPFLARFGWPMPLGGTSNHFRKAVLQVVGGWDAYNVTEDADLGFRLAAAGYRSDVIEPMTTEEAPERFRPWLKQRTRWLKGHIQTWAVHMREPQDLARGAGRAGPRILNLTLGGTVITALLHGPVALYCLWQFAASLWGEALHIGALTLFASGYLAAGLCAIVGARRARIELRIIDLMRMPLYWPMQTIAVLFALRELRLRPYFWAKTEHGFTAAPETPCPFKSPSHSWPPPLRSSSLPPGRRAPNPTRPRVRA